MLKQYSKKYIAGCASSMMHSHRAAEPHDLLGLKAVDSSETKYFKYRPIILSHKLVAD